MASNFLSGFQTGQNFFNDRNKTALQWAAEQRAQEEFDRKKTEWARDDARYTADQADIEALTNPNASNFKLGTPQQAPGMKAAPGALGGGLDVSSLPADQGGSAAPVSYGLGGPVSRTGMQGDASLGSVSLKQNPEGADAEAIVQRMALRKGDLSAFQGSQDRARKFKGDAETRKFAEDMQALYAAATAPDATPEAKAAWAKAASPFTQMVSGFNGMSFDARVNPQTGQLEMIPYDGGTVQPVSFAQAMPYMLAGNRLISKYGDVDAAVKALHDMTEEQRKAVMEGTTFRVGLKKTEADNVGQVLTRAETKRHNKATEDNAAARLGMERQRYNEISGRERMGQVQYFEDPVTKEVKAYIPSSGKDGIVWNELPTPQGMRPLRANGAAAATLNDREKIAYTEVVKVLANLPPDTAPAQVAAVYRQYGLDPEKFGVTDPNKIIADAIKAKQSGGGGGATPVAGRPLYNTPQSDLRRMASKPRGVSSEEAAAAQAELEARKGESRISGF